MKKKNIVGIQEHVGGEGGSQGCDVIKEDNEK